MVKMDLLVNLVCPARLAPYSILRALYSTSVRVARDRSTLCRDRSPFPWDSRGSPGNEGLTDLSEFMVQKDILETQVLLEMRVGRVLEVHQEPLVNLAKKADGAMQVKMGTMDYQADEETKVSWVMRDHLATLDQWDVRVDEAPMEYRVQMVETEGQGTQDPRASRDMLALMVRRVRGERKVPLVPPDLQVPLVTLVFLALLVHWDLPARMDPQAFPEEAEHLVKLVAMESLGTGDWWVCLERMEEKALLVPLAARVSRGGKA